MISPSDLKKEIEARLRSYLSRDKSGIRKALLGLIVEKEGWTLLRSGARSLHRNAERLGVRHWKNG